MTTLKIKNKHKNKDLSRHQSSQLLKPITLYYDNGQSSPPDEKGQSTSALQTHQPNISMGILKEKVKEGLERVIIKMVNEQNRKQCMEHILKLEKENRLQSLIKRIEQMIEELMGWGTREKKVRVRCCQRRRIRMIGDNVEESDEEIWKNIQKKNSEIYDLLQKNKKLQKKILLISHEYQQNKRVLEEEVQRLKYVLNNSLNSMNEFANCGKPFHHKNKQLVHSKSGQSKFALHQNLVPQQLMNSNRNMMKLKYPS